MSFRARPRICRHYKGAVICQITTDQLGGLLATDLCQNQIPKFWRRSIAGRIGVCGAKPPESQCRRQVWSGVSVNSREPVA